ncbi:MAG: Gldg family protein [Clostridia bacterium]|nr:Gldg family protein [Clostridia bacterium]
MFIMLKKELRQLFGSVRGFAVIAILLLFCGVYTVFRNMLTGTPSFSSSLPGIFPAFVLALPLLTYKSFSSERACGTNGLLYSLSLRPAHVVLGKYFAHLSILLISMAVIALYPLLLSFFGTVDMAESYFAWFGLLLLGAALLSLCLYLSVFFKKNWINWVLSAGVLLALLLINTFLTSIPSAAWFSFAVLELLLVGACVFLWLVIGSRIAAICATALPVALAFLFIFLPDIFLSLLPKLLSRFNPFSRFLGFIYGRFDLEGILFFICFTAFFVVLTVLTVSHRHDSEFDTVAQKITPAMTKKRLLLSASAFVLAILLIALNLLASLLPWSIRSRSLSNDPVFGLSTESKRLSRSLNEEVTLYLLCENGELGADPDILSFLKNYESQSSHISVDVVDTKTEAEFLTDHGIGAMEEGAVCFVVESARRYMLLSLADLYYYYYESDEGTLYLSPAEYSASAESLASLGYTMTPYFNGEEGITNAIRFVTLEKVPTVAIVQSAYQDESGNVIPLNAEINDTVVQSLRQYSCDVQYILSVSELTEEHEVLIFNSPLLDLTRAETDALSAWLEAGGSMILTTYCNTKEQPNLASVLAEYGLSADDKNIRVNEENTSYVNGSYHVAMAGAHKVTDPLVDSIVVSDVHAIYFDLDHPNTEITRLLYTTTSATRSSYDASTGKWTKLDEDPASYTYGAIAEKGDSKILWVSTPYLLDLCDPYMQNGNHQLLLSSIGFMSSEDLATIDLAANSMASNVLLVSLTAFVLWLIILVVLLPSALLAIGLLRRSVRRRA